MYESMAWIWGKDIPLGRREWQEELNHSSLGLLLARLWYQELATQKSIWFYEGEFIIQEIEENCEREERTATAWFEKNVNVGFL